jgi:hypothetical protein
MDNILFNGKIYKITNEENDYVYIGSTILTLNQRLAEHIDGYNAWIKRNYRRRYVSSFEILRFKGYKIELIENFECTNNEMTKNEYIKELRKREGYYQLTNKCVNIIIANGRPADVIYIDNDEFYKCPCGRSIVNTYYHKIKHLKTALHRKKIKELHTLSQNRD